MSMAASAPPPPPPGGNWQGRGDKWEPPYPEEDDEEEDDVDCGFLKMQVICLISFSFPIHLPSALVLPFVRT